MLLRHYSSTTPPLILLPPSKQLSSDHYLDTSGESSKPERDTYLILSRLMSIISDSGTVSKTDSRLGSTIVHQTAWLRPAAYWWQSRLVSSKTVFLHFHFLNYWMAKFWIRLSLWVLTSLNRLRLRGLVPLHINTTPHSSSTETL